MVATGGSEDLIFSLLGVRINHWKDAIEDCGPVGNLLAVGKTAGLSVLACEMIHHAFVSHHCNVASKLRGRAGRAVTEVFS